MSRSRIVAGRVLVTLLVAVHLSGLLALAAAPAGAHGEGGPPAKGSYQVVAGEVPDGVAVTILQGSTAGVLLEVTGGSTVEILDEYGEQLARVTPETRQLAWVDSRLRTPGQPPADSGVDTVVRSWQIPIRVDGEPTLLAGEVRWRTLGAPAHEHPTWNAGWQVSTAAVGLTLAGGLAFVLAVDRRRRRADAAAGFTT